MVIFLAFLSRTGCQGEAKPMRIGAILAAAAVAAWLLGPQPGAAQDAGTSAAPADQQPKRLSEAELDQLVAPIALYPDPLLSKC
jgi:hypothetical protein